MPRSTNPLFIDWTPSEARIVLLDDLEEGILSSEEDEVPAEVAYEVYKNLPAFKDLVVFDQFKDQLRDHWKQVKKRREQLSVEMAALLHDRQLYP